MNYKDFQGESKPNESLLPKACYESHNNIFSIENYTAILVCLIRKQPVSKRTLFEILI
jgi:hypothetical protein